MFVITIVGLLALVVICFVAAWWSISSIERDYWERTNKAIEKINRIEQKVMENYLRAGDGAGPLELTKAKAKESAPVNRDTWDALNMVLEDPRFNTSVGRNSLTLAKSKLKPKRKVAKATTKAKVKTVKRTRKVSK
jgi:hypothetical protein